METWKPVKDFPGYEVSDHGNVRSFKNSSGAIVREPHSVKRQVRENSATRVTLSINAWAYCKTVAVLVLTTFGKPAPHPSWRPAYRDGNKNNLKLENLYWIPHSSNCKLNGKDVQNILAERMESNTPEELLAARYGVSKRSIQNVVNGKTWKNATQGDSNAAS